MFKSALWAGILGIALQACSPHAAASAPTSWDAAACQTTGSTQAVPAAALLQRVASHRKGDPIVGYDEDDGPTIPPDAVMGHGRADTDASHTEATNATAKVGGAGSSTNTGHEARATAASVAARFLERLREPEMGLADREAKWIGLIAFALLLCVFFANIFAGSEEPQPGRLAADRLLEAARQEAPGSSSDKLVHTEAALGQKIPHACYVMTFPRRTTESDSEFRFSLSAGIMGYLTWSEKVPGREYAREAFHRFGEKSLISEDEIDDIFQEHMTTHEYHVQARRLISQILGLELHLNLSAAPSSHGDEVILQVSLPADPDALRQVAAHMRYHLPLSDKAYEQVGTKIVRDQSGHGIRGFSAFLPEHAGGFEPFRQVDMERILMSRIDHYINLTALGEQGVLLHYFLPHNGGKVDQLTTIWARFGLWFRPPSHSVDTHLKDYFGEGVSWIFVWHTHFTNSLMLPAGLGAVVFWRRFVGISLESQRVIQLMYAAIIIVWAAFFNSSWDRLQERLKEQWGMHPHARWICELSLRNNNFRSDLASSILNRVFFIKLFSDLLVTGVVAASVGGTLMIQNWRNKQDDKLLKMSAAMVLSMQIVLIDFAWLRVSKIIVSGYMNYRTEEDWVAGWVQRVFWPRLFNNLFPFVYIGFFKPYWFPEQCPQTEAGCLEEVELNLIVYFMARVFVQLGGDIGLMLVAKVQVWLELSGVTSGGETPDGVSPRGSVDFGYIEAQSKAFPYDKQVHLEDWMDLTMIFVFVACFSVALPAISFMALLTSLSEGRLVAYRNLHYLRRPDPHTSGGIGIWRDIMGWVEVLAILMNTAVAIFVMKPIRDYSWSTKWIAFVCAEHSLLIIREVFQAKFPHTPVEVEEAREQNHRTILALLAPETSDACSPKERSASRDTPRSLDIGPDAFPHAGNTKTPVGRLAENAALALSRFRPPVRPRRRSF